MNANKLSNDATLASLEVDSLELSPEFSPEVTEYEVTVESSVDSIIISATPSHTGATVSGTGEKALDNGSNSFPIMITSEDNSNQKVYTISVTRLYEPLTKPILSVESIDYNSILLSWTPSRGGSIDDNKRYDVYRDGSLIVSDLTNTTYTDLDVQPNITYNYFVKARDVAALYLEIDSDMQSAIINLNNSPSTAIDLTGGGTITDSLYGTTDERWYKVTTPSDWKIVDVMLTPTDKTNLTDSELRVRIYESVNASKSAVNNYVDSSDVRHVHYASTQSKTLYIKVHGNALDSEREYHLNLKVSEPEYDLDISPVQQQQSKWCWVAVGKMAGENYWKKLNNYAIPTRSLTQRQIAVGVNGHAGDYEGWAYNAIQYVLEDSMEINAFLYGDVCRQFTDEEIFETLVTKEQPVVIRVGEPGHFVVISKFKQKSSGTAQVTFVDPWYGKSYIANPDTIRNAGLHPGKDNRTWTHTTIIKKTIQ